MSSGRLSVRVPIAVACGWVALAAQPTLPHAASTTATGARPAAAWQSEGGAELWRVAGAGRGTPAVDSDTVFALSRGGELLAMDRRDGAIRWRRPTSPNGTPTAGSSVRRWDRLVIAGDEDIVAFDAATGEPSWRFEPGEGHGPGHYLGEVVDGVVFAGSPSGHLFAVDAVSGRQRWRATVMAGTSATVHEPLADGGLVVAGYTVHTSPPAGGVVAFEADTGRPRWQRALMAHQGSPFTAGWGGGLALAGGRVFATGRDGSLWALALSDGEPAWLVPAGETGCPPEPERPDLRPITLSRGLLVAGSLSGCVAGYDLDAHVVRWRFRDVRLGSTAIRLASDGLLVYIPYLSGRLVALERDTGLERWRLGDSVREFIWAPAAAGRQVFLTSSSGYSAHAR